MVVINGLRGIGKSSLAKLAQHFLSERKLSTSGNIYIECKHVKDIYALLKTMQRQLINLMSLSITQRSEIL